MSDNKSIRLSKAASELGVGIDRLREILEEKGFEKVRPNTKIDGETYSLLEQEFLSDKQAKEKSQKLNENKVVRETITLEDKVIKPQVQSSEKYENDEIFIRNLSEADIAKPTEVREEQPSKPEETQPEATPTEDSTRKETVEEKPKEKTTFIELNEEEVEHDGVGPKVLAKINLEDVDPRVKKKKQQEEAKKKKEQEHKERAEKAAKEAEAKKKQQEVKAAEEKARTEKESPKEDVKEHIDTKVEKLSGITVLGKIEIKEEPKKRKPVASSSPEKQPDKKKKRKRISSSPGGDRNRKRPDNKKKGSPEVKRELTEEEIQNQVRETLARLSGGGGKSKASKHRKAKRDQAQMQAEEQRQQQAEEQKVLKVTEFVTVSELSSLMNVSANEVIGACMSLGLFVSINQRLDAETISIVSEEFGYTVEFTTEEIDENALIQEDNEAFLAERPPIITIMGHVDHGKTSLLDHIRKANVIAGEAGGITQHIGAYSVKLPNKKTISFLDTPGHEAFTAMRARGAQVTDIVIIVIAADDRVMPQTKEAINHAQAAGVPMIFAFNKMDKEGANADKIREELSQMNILVEDWGGKFQSQEISAKSGMNVDELLEKVLLEAELLELKADPKKRAHGTVIEASLDKGKGYVTTILVQAGTLKIGDMLLAGSQVGRVKALFNERGNQVKEAGPSIPVTMLGLSGAPNAGDRFVIMEDEREAKEIANKRLQLQREQGVKTQKHITLDEIGRRIAIGDFQELNVIVKGDVDGSVEALSDSLINLSTEQIQVNIIHKSVGQVSESDVLLATASDAIIIGFQVRPSGSARKLAEKEEIEIRSYSVIYDAIDEVKAAMEGMLAPKVEEKIVCNIEVRETFKISKVGTIAGCYVLDGKVTRNTRIRLIRDGVVVYTGELGSLKRFKDDVKEVASGYECGLNIQNFNDVKVGDIIEGYEEVEVKQTL